ncbi:MAG TPA: 1-acyl-sn-glycerol-3-phosphate acyltransferase [Acidimicrobiia bacterium]|nr:1-acyl-sn-glycerol-3-phosphate acyltransferase [Acidimicrobiia bacterium]
MFRPPDVTRPAAFEPDLDVPENRPVVVLLDASSTLERRMLTAWADRTFGERGTQINITPSRRRRRRRTDPALAARLQRGDNPLVVPVRVTWLPDRRSGRRSANWVDVLKLGDPRDPDPARQWAILAFFPHRVGIVAGMPASAEDLLASHAADVEYSTLVDHVTRKAHITLERAERHIRGNRYKVPRFLNEEILSRPDFRDTVMRLGSERGLPAELALARARYYLREIAASHSTFLIDLIANAIHWIYSQGYGAIIYDQHRLAVIGTLAEDHPIAFVPSHRSNLDRLSLQYLLWENDMPPNHTAAGINMNFFPIGPLIRRTGAFFIRRSFKDNELYKFVLRSYLGYLVEKRFPLEWYMEGGRSRSGKLLPPRLGMLGWVTDAVRQGRADDLYLIPTSIAYDQIQDVKDYANEAAGGEKRKESFGWALDAIRSLRRRYGNIHVRFADPISIAKEVDLSKEAEMDLQKLAFEVMYRISRVTPITPTAVASIALLSARGKAMRASEIAVLGGKLAEVIEEGGWPTTERIRLHDIAAAEAVLHQLVAHGSLTVEAGVYVLTPNQAIQAAYYRNTVVHYFVPGAIAELALSATDTADPLDDFWQEVARLRDLLKFEFFFAERDEFRRELAAELDRGVPGWQDHIRRGERHDVLRMMDPLRAHWAVLPFLEAYRVVAEELVATNGPVENEKAFLEAALERGARDRLTGRVEADESVSKALMQSALELARNRGLLDGPQSRRQLFAAEVSAVCERAAEIGRLADTPRLAT